MWDVKPGDLVVCVNVGVLPENVFRTYRQTVRDAGLEQGQVYTVRAVGKNPNSGCPALWLEEISRPILSGREHWGEVGFDIRRFRPVSKTRTEEFLRLVAPTNTQEPVR